MNSQDYINVLSEKLMHYDFHRFSILPSPSSHFNTNLHPFTKSDGYILYVVILINSKEIDLQLIENTKTYYNTYFETNHFLESYKSIIITNIFVSHHIIDPIKSWINNSELFLEQQIYNINWGVEISENGYNFISSPQQPNKILNLQTLMLESANAITQNEISSPTKTYGLIPVTEDTSLVYYIVIINALVLAMLTLNGGSYDSTVLIRFGALYPKAIFEDKEYYRIFTAMFLHIGFAHFLSNSFALYIVGTRVVKYYGKLKFIFIYVLSGIVGNIVSLIFMANLSAGASGAVLGIEGALAALILKTGKKADGFSVLFIILFVTASISFSALIPNVNNYAHIGGLVSGFILGYILYNPQPHKLPLGEVE